VSQSPNLLHTSPEHARLRVLEDFILGDAPELTDAHPANLDIEPTPLTVYDHGVVLSPRGQERRAPHRIAAPSRADSAAGPFVLGARGHAHGGVVHA
jgi:hypothetical protein